MCVGLGGVELSLTPPVCGDRGDARPLNAAPAAPRAFLYCEGEKFCGFGGVPQRAVRTGQALCCGEGVLVPAAPLSWRLGGLWGGTSVPRPHQIPIPSAPGRDVLGAGGLWWWRSERGGCVGLFGPFPG